MNALVTHFADAAEPTGIRSSDRAKWLDARRQLLTASDVAAVMGEDDYRSPLAVYAEKLGESEDLELTPEDAAWWGQRLEQPILLAVADHYGWTYQAGGELLRSRKHPHLGATLDAEIQRAPGAAWEVLEGKTTRMPAGWNEDSGELPTRVLIQVQSQLLVTGAPLAVVFALLQGSRPVRIEVHPSPEFHQVIVEESERFMTRVRDLDAPAPDHRESSRQALFRLHPKDSGAGIYLPADAADWTAEIQAINAQVKELEKRKAELSNLLRAAIGSATYGLLPGEVEGQRAWKLGLEERPEHVVSASSGRVLRAIKKVPPVPIAASIVDEVFGPRPTDAASLAAAPRVEERAISRQRRRARR